MFNLDVAKVDRNVAHVAMATDVYFKCIFRIFHLFFQTYVLQVFHLDVAYIFTSVSDVCSKCFSCFHTYFASVSSGCFKSRSSVAASVLDACFM